MRPGHVHCLDGSVVASPAAPHALDSSEGEDSCRTVGSLLLRLRDKTDHSAWTKFVDRYTPMIRSWCRTWFPREADDMVQEVMAKLVGTIESFEYGAKPGRFRGWLKTVTRNLMAELKRGRPSLVLTVDTDLQYHVAQEQAVRRPGAAPGGRVRLTAPGNGP